jgi:predicted metal-dependent phosphoesterase TrpH
VKELKTIDLHMHSTVSDGTDSPEEILSRLKEKGISVFSLTDHDATKGCKIIRKVLEKTKDSTTFINGAEFSCKDEDGKYHILGYGFDMDNEEIKSVVEHGHALRMKKVNARLDFLKTRFGFSFPKEEIENLLSLNNPGKPHIGNLMVKYGYAHSKEEAITEYINGIHFESEYVRPEEAISGIIESGGKAVLAHPFFGSGDELLLGDEMDGRIRKLKEYGLCGIEAFYSGFSAKLVNDALSLAEKYDLYVSAGSDYHGNNKLVQLGDTGLDDGKDLPGRLVCFLESLGIADAECKL